MSDLAPLEESCILIPNICGSFYDAISLLQKKLDDIYTGTSKKTQKKHDERSLIDLSLLQLDIHSLQEILQDLETQVFYTHKYLNSYTATINVGISKIQQLLSSHTDKSDNKNDRINYQDLFQQLGSAIIEHLVKLTYPQPVTFENTLKMF